MVVVERIPTVGELERLERLEVEIAALVTENVALRVLVLQAAADLDRPWTGTPHAIAVSLRKQADRRRCPRTEASRLPIEAAGAAR